MVRNYNFPEDLKNLVAINTRHLGNFWYCKAEIEAVGAGKRVIQASDRSRKKAETQIFEELLKLFSKN